MYSTGAFMRCTLKTVSQLRAVGKAPRKAAPPGTSRATRLVGLPAHMPPQRRLDAATTATTLHVIKQSPLHSIAMRHAHLSTAAVASVRRWVNHGCTSPDGLAVDVEPFLKDALDVGILGVLRAEGHLGGLDAHLVIVAEPGPVQCHGIC